MTSKKIATTLTVLFGLSILSGCTNANASKDALAEIKQAQTKNKELENGTFEITHNIQNALESYEEKVAGAFIKQGEADYDWHRAAYNTNQEPFGEWLIKDGTEYQKFFVPEGVTEWHEIPEVTTTFQEHLGPLFEMKDDWQIASTETEEIDGETHYHFTLAESHGEQIREESIDALRETIEFLKENGAGEEAIQNIEAAITEREQTTYSDLEVTYHIDAKGQLVLFEMSITAAGPDGVAHKMVNTVAFTEYNISDPSDLLPVIE